MPPGLSGYEGALQLASSHVDLCCSSISAAAETCLVAPVFGGRCSGSAGLRVGGSLLEPAEGGRGARARERRSASQPPHLYGCIEARGANGRCHEDKPAGTRGRHRRHDARGPARSGVVGAHQLPGRGDDRGPSAGAGGGGGVQYRGPLQPHRRHPVQRRLSRRLRWWRVSARLVRMSLFAFTLCGSCGRSRYVVRAGAGAVSL